MKIAMLLFLGFSIIFNGNSQVCNTPSELSATNLTNFSADLSWVENGTATIWTIEYGPTGFSIGTGTVLFGVSTNPFTLTNLMPCMTYDFYVRAHCGAGVFSAWGGPHEFSTSYMPFTETDTQIACTDFTWIDGVVYTASNNTATHTIVGVAAFGCDSIITLDLTIEVESNAGDDTSKTYCLNQPIDLDTLLSSGADAGGSYYGPANAPLVGSVIAVSNQMGTYVYKYVTAPAGFCPADTAFITIVANAGCDYLSLEKEVLADLYVYPNPAISIITILNPSNPSALKMEMLNMDGRIVLIDDEALNNAKEASLIIDHLENGVYTLRIYNSESQKIFKIVKR